MEFKLNILTFHRVVESPYFIPPMAIQKKVFKRLLKRLGWLGRIISLSQAVQAINQGGLKGRNFAITFDDGYLDNYRVAGPILAKLGMPATFFVPFQHIEEQKNFWWDYIFQAVKIDRHRLIELLIDRGVSILPKEQLAAGPYARTLVQAFNRLSEKNRQMLVKEITNEFRNIENNRLLMKWNEVKELSKKGFEIGSHTISHTPLTDLDDKEAKHEIAHSKKLISRRVGLEVKGFCYPRGAFSDKHAGMVKQSGYSYAVSTRFGVNKDVLDLYALNRRSISDYPDFRNRFGGNFHLMELTGLFDPILNKRRIA